MSEIMDECKKMVQSKGFPVNIGSDFCKSYLASHPNCHGCESEEGCGRMMRLAHVMLKPLAYKPNSFEDSQKMEKWMLESVEKILDHSVSMEELRKI